MMEELIPDGPSAQTPAAAATGIDIDSDDCIDETDNGQDADDTPG